MVKGTTQVHTDPVIVTDGVTDSGGLYRSAAQDGLMTNYLFGSTSAFDLTQFNKNGGPNSDGSPAFPAGLATFKFSNLKIIGVPTFLTAGGSLEVALVSEGTITSGAPGGVFNLDSLDILALATVNGSITLGPELSFTSTRTFIPGPNSNPELFVYARGATSDVVFGSNVNFADRRLELTAERNVQISSQITVTSPSSNPLTRNDDDVRIRAGNNFILDPTGRITALLARVSIKANDVAGSGGALVDAYALDIQTQSAANFTQSGSLLFMNTLPIGQTTQRYLSVNGGAGLTLPGDITINSPNSEHRIDLKSENGNVVINGHLTTNHNLGISASGNFVLGPSGRITAPFIEVNAQDVAGSGSAVIDGASAEIRINIRNTVTLTQSGTLLKVNSLPIDQASPLQGLSISADAGLNIPSDVNINSLPGSNPDFQLSSNGTMTINGKLSSPDIINIDAKNLAVGPLALIQGFSVRVTLSDTVNPSTVTASGSQIFFNSLPIDLTGSNVNISAPTMNVAANLTLPAASSVEIGRTNAIFVPDTNVLSSFTADTVQVPGNITGDNLLLGGNTTVTGNVNALGLSVATLNVGGTVSVNGIFWDGFSTFNGNVPNGTPTPAGSPPTSPSTLSAASINAPFGIDFKGPDEGSGQSDNPNDGRVLTLNTGAVVFDTIGAAPLIGASTFNGGDALPGNGKAGGSGGTLNVNATADITVNAPISATSGVNSTAVTSGGNGGNVNLVSTGGTVTVSSSIDVSHNDTPNRRVSASGGNIKLQSGKTAGTAINVTNSGNLRALLNAAAPGPGGTVVITSAGGDVNIAGTLRADRGTVSVQNNGLTGIINLLAGHNISADVVKVGALGNNGILNIGGGSISADTLLKLYAGGTNGTINFVSNQNLNGAGAKIIAAKTVNVNSGVNVGISGGSATFHTDNPNYNGAGIVKPGFGTVTGPASTQSHASRPAF